MGVNGAAVKRIRKAASIRICFNRQNVTEGRSPLGTVGMTLKTRCVGQSCRPSLSMLFGKIVFPFFPITKTELYCVVVPLCLTIANKETNK